MFTINRILRGELGFDGFIVSDWNSLPGIVVHGCAADARAVVRRVRRGEYALGLFDHPCAARGARNHPRRRAGP